MALRAVEHTFTGPTTPYTQYDQTKTILGDLIRQYTGPSAQDCFAGPCRMGRDVAQTQVYGLARPMEASVQIPGIYPHVVRWANKRGFYSTGTVAVSGTAVTGSGTGWFTDGVPVGARIGFGSTNAAEITTWYNINTIASDTSITLSTSAGTLSGGTSFVIDKALQIDWIFLGDNAAVTTTRRVVLYTFNRETSIFNWVGFITITYPAGPGNQTIKGLRVAYAKYSTGTVAVSGATVTGTGSAWNVDRITIGSRIGFGSTDPTQISTWYYINAVSSDTSMTIQTNVTATGTGGNAANLSISSGTAYVIEDMHALTVTTSVVTGDGGLTSVSGLSYDDFIPGGQTISAATSVDKTKAAYSLCDINAAYYTTGTVSVSGTAVTGTGSTWAAATHLGCMIGFGSTNPASITTWYTITAVGSATSITLYSSAGTIGGGTAYVIQGTNRTAAGIALDDRDSWTQQYCYIIDAQTATTPSVFKYNFRANLTSLGGVSQGKSAGAWVLTTGTQTVTGNTSVTNNGRVGTLLHGGVGVSGVKSLFFATTSRICRAPISAITQGANSWVSDAMVEVPTGSTATYNLSSVLTAVEIADQIDRLIITGTGAGTIPANNRAFVTQYNTISNPFDLAFLVDTRQIDQSTASTNSIPHANPQGAALNVWSEGGLVYISRTGATALTNLMYAVPLGADWDFAAGSVKQRLITPSLSTPNISKLTRVTVSKNHYLGSSGLQLQTEGCRIYYRTAGISDDSGAWTLVDDTGSLSSATPAAAIQFMLEFRTIGTFCLPCRLFSISCMYEDLTTDSHYQPSVGQSSLASKRFAWRFSTAFGGTVPTLRVQLFDAVTGGSLGDDNTTSPTGTFEKSTDGGSNWVTYNTSDKTNETTYIRYTPASLGDNIKVRALLTQL